MRRIPPRGHWSVARASSPDAQPRERAQSGSAQTGGERSSALRSRRRTTVCSLALTASTTPKGRDPAPLREQAAPADDDDLIRVVGVPLVADVVEPTEVRAVACHDPVTLGGSEEATEVRLSPQAPFSALIARPFVHGRQA